MKNLNLDETVMEITKALGEEKQFISLKTCSGDVMVWIGEKDPYAPIIDGRSIVEDGKNQIFKYDFTVPDLHEASDRFRMLYAVEIVNYIMVYDSLGVEGSREYIDALNLIFFDHKLNSWLNENQVADGFCKNVLTSDS